MGPFQFFGFLWLVRNTRTALFYLYLWQLKEYHIGRFLAHFDTDKGRKLIFDPINILKIILLLAFPALPLLAFFGAFFIYLLEFPKVFFDFIGNKIKRPILTKKAVFLICASLVLEIAFLFIIFRNLWYFERFIIFWNVRDIVIFTFWILFFDVLAPVIFSIIVLLFQPFAVLMRKRIINKAKKRREQFKKLLVVGITGSYGKTSTKEFLYAILAEKLGKDRVLKTQAHQNSEVGISNCILNNLNENHRIFIVEMGAYNTGGIKLLCDITKPKIGVLTGINEQHMATFGSQENIIKTKYELIESLPVDGVAFFNAKNKYCIELYERSKIKKLLYGEEAKFFGEENVLGAIAVAKELGVVIEVKPQSSWLKPKIGVNGLNIIDSTYSANPTGVIAHLDYLTLRFPQGKKIIVMPCLIELGRSSKEVHQRIGKKIGEICDLAIITTKDRFAEIKKTAGEKAIFMNNPNNILKKIKSFTKEGDVVLLESRVPGKLISLLSG